MHDEPPLLDSLQLLHTIWARNQEQRRVRVCVSAGGWPPSRGSACGAVIAGAETFTLGQWPACLICMPSKGVAGGWVLGSTRQVPAGLLLVGAVTAWMHTFMSPNASMLTTQRGARGERL